MASEVRTRVICYLYLLSPFLSGSGLPMKSIHWNRRAQLNFNLSQNKFGRPWRCRRLERRTSALEQRARFRPDIEPRSSIRMVGPACYWLAALFAEVNGWMNELGAQIDAPKDVSIAIKIMVRLAQASPGDAPSVNKTTTSTEALKRRPRPPRQK